MAPGAAVVESVRTRFRPIMMTTMTSVIGMSPLVLQPGAGSELYRGLGSVVLGGLLVASIFTLGVVPMLLTLVLDSKKVLFGAADKPAAEAMEKWRAASAIRPTGPIAKPVSVGPGVSVDATSNGVVGEAQPSKETVKTPS